MECFIISCLTDLPVIISENFCGFLEPHEEIWRNESGKGFKLKYLTRVCPDSLTPYNNICGFSKSQASFNGKTILRFPLRKKESKISKKECSISELKKLIETLKSEAKCLLLFLRSVRSIEVIEISSFFGKHNSLFKVVISPDDAYSHSIQQQSLLEQVKSSFMGPSPLFVRKVIQEKFHFRIEIQGEGNHRPSVHEWLVIHRVGSEDLDVLEAASRQHVLPWVGAAYELGEHSSSASNGRIFCFLPLPIENTAPFSVHVNGTFAISSNRRTLKWESVERYNDPEATWNKLLVERCISKCYAQLIFEILKIPGVSPNMVYSCWPSNPIVRDSPWKGMLTPLFNDILTHDSVVFTGANGGQWIQLNDAIFVPYVSNNKQFKQIVVSVLIASGCKLVQIPSHNLDAVEIFFGQNIRFLSPSVTKSVLAKNTVTYEYLTRNDKLDLLKYCLSDKIYRDLQTLKLLPLANGSFAKFEFAHSKNVYICCTEIPRTLLPGVEHLFVDLIREDPDLQKMLHAVASCGRTCLKVLQVSTVAKLLPLSNPANWSDAQLEMFWNWVCKYQLTLFKDQCIVPVKHAQRQKLGKISNLIYVSKYQQLSLQLKSGLEKFGIRFACQANFPFLTHPQMDSCVYQLQGLDVLNAMTRNCAFGVTLSNDEALAIQHFLSSWKSYFMGSTHAQKRLFELPLFSVIQKSGRYSINDVCSDRKALLKKGTFYFVSTLLPSSPLIINDGHDLLDQFSVSCVTPITGVECLQKCVFPLIRNNRLPRKKLDEFVSVLENLYTLVTSASCRDVFLEQLSILPFVITKAGNVQAPSCLFNPDCGVLREIFYDQADVFPSESYTRWTKELVMCGLRNLDSLTAKDIYDILCACSSSKNIFIHDQTVVTRVKAVFSHIANNTDLLDEQLHITNTLKQTIFDRSLSHAVFPIAKSPPQNYPKCLNWKGSTLDNNCLMKFNSNNSLFLPSQPSCQPLPEIIGSEVYFFEGIPTELSSLFSSCSDQLVDVVVKHFSHVINKRCECDSETLKQIALQTYNFLQSCNSIDLSSLDEWVWIDSQSEFVKPEKCALRQNTSYRNSLEPFIYTLPKVMAKYKSLLCKNGVEEYVTTDQIISVLNCIGEQEINITLVDAWAIIKNVIDWAIAEGHVCSDLLVPVMPSEDNDFPQLYPASEVFYADLDMFVEMAFEEASEFKLVHPHFAHLATQLGLPLLSDELNITQDAFDDVGQQESLINRLTNILEEYKDGLTIIKELIQNADDAGATEVNIVYDARQHTTQNLFFKGMADSHGPALVVHNNAQFRKEDFENITKLAGATKRDDPLKIGKFGIGFCSVYHITDVPSFVSGEWLYIFDPTLGYLKGVVKNENQPGKKVKYTSPFIARTQQLAPYQNLFDFNPARPYSGTMFRLPFRLQSSALCPTRYNKTMIHQLLDDLFSNCDSILLFLSNVRKISFQCINDNNVKLNEQLKVVKRNFSQGINEITISCPGKEDDKRYWVKANHKLNLNYDISVGKSSIGVSSVACQLKKVSSNNYEVVPIDGCLFCFLPLSVPSTGLPVHIHANFAVMNNRSGIWCSTKSTKHTVERQNKDEAWNGELIEKVLPHAYCGLLTKLKQLQQDRKLDIYNFFSLWPLSSTLRTQVPWIDLIEPVYNLILDNSLFYSNFIFEWKMLNEGRVFEQKMLSNLSFDNETNEHCIFQVAKLLKLSIFDLPSKYMQEIVTMPIIALAEYAAAFFENIDVFKNRIETRNDFLLYILQELGRELEQAEGQEYYCLEEGEISCEYDCALEDLLKKYPCIPCSPNGVMLKQCDSTIDPDCSLSELFVDKDSVFCLPIFRRNRLVCIAMIHLGMHTDTLPWEMLLECAGKIPQNYENDCEKALRQVNVIIDCCEKNIGNDELFTESAVILSIRNTPFLPILQKPEDYALPWYGEKQLFCAPKDVLKFDIVKAPFLVGSQKCILDTGKGYCEKIPSKVIKLLKVQKSIQSSDVLAHYKLFLKLYSQYKKIGISVVEYIESTCHYVYNYLEAELQKQTSQSTCTSESVYDEVSKFKCEPFVWSGSQFVSPQIVALEWTKDGPFLFKPHPMLLQHKHLMKSLGIGCQFSINKLIETFRTMLEVLGTKIPKKCYPVVIDMLELFNKSENIGFNEQIVEKVVLPNDDYRLYSVNKLAFNDTAWIKVHVDAQNFVHKNLSRSAAISLGVRPVRDVFLDPYKCKESSEQMSLECSSDGVEKLPFGQKESLTDRIKNILRDYPLDVTLLKEFLQNADDAKASKVFVILDKRQHSGKFVPSDKWSELQGPALLIWNDKDFQDEDLAGIQSLGVGSKRNDSESIGEFGIGFNVVYHITDCPSLLTRRTILCVLDPLCRYVPDASEDSPGCRYNTDKKFWGQMKDLQNPFMLSKRLPGQPDCLTKGTLFRFPLRVKDAENDGIAQCITVSKMEKLLNKWVEEVKDALLFLKYVTCFKMFIIDDKECTFVPRMSCDVIADRQEYQTKLKDHDRKPFLSMYPLTVNRLNCKGKRHSEKWLIQQGIGDIIDKPNEIVPLNSVHAIAAPFESSDNFSGKIFCFLPLPKPSGLPVHINGCFVLNSSRQSLWPGDCDDKAQWNANLLEAIASSYVRFVTNMQCYLFYNCDQILKNAISNYYAVFPYWLKESEVSSDVKEEVVMINECKDLAKHFFEKLIKTNSEILILMENNEIRWYPIRNRIDPFNQVYFLDDSTTDSQCELIQVIQMKLTSAPARLRMHLPSELTINPKSVHHFYCKFSHKILKQNLPCLIQDTPFKSVDTFVAFIELITRFKEHSDEREFVESPESQPLLLTADGSLQSFQMRSLIYSEQCYLFPNSKYLFLHPLLVRKCKFDYLYFRSSKDIDSQTVEKLMHRNYPMLYGHEALRSVISDEDLKKILSCFNKNCIFERHEKSLLNKWALLPATNRSLYSSSSKIKPIVANNRSDIFSLLDCLNVPFLDTSARTVNVMEYCPNLSDVDRVLCILYEMHQKENIFDHLPNSKRQRVKTLLTYFSRCSFRHNSDLLEQIKSFPLFYTVSGKRTCLLNKDVYLWPSSACKTGLNKWLEQQKNVVFLCESGSWTCLCGSDLSVLCDTLSFNELDIYNQFIFKEFNELNGEEKLEHLEHIRDSLYKDVVYRKDECSKSREFLLNLSEVECIPHPCKEDCYVPIVNFYNHEVEIFKAFPDRFLFVEETFRAKEWMNFLKEIGMHQEVDFETFVELCHVVSEMENASRASFALVKYLFSSDCAKTWYSIDDYLDVIKNIRFLVPNDMSKFKWIQEPYRPKCMTESDKCWLTCFSEVASYDCSQLIWTIKPVVVLPKPDDEMIQAGVIQKLGITCIPLAKDIYQNIVNISETDLANFNLLKNYDLKPYDKESSEDIFEIMAENFSKLDVCDPDLSKLRTVSCIPVCVSNDINKPVLVNSYQVVSSDSDSSLIPYISILPNCLYKCLNSLTKIGMCQVISLENIQYLLKFLFCDFSVHQATVSLHDRVIIRSCISKLVQLLQNCDHQEVQKMFTPGTFFLPSSEGGRLFPVSELVYIDCSRYQKHAKSIKFAKSGYNVFQIPRDCPDNLKINETSLCRLLPESVRPERLSFICSETPSSTSTNECEETGPLFKHFCKLNQLLTSDVGRISHQFENLMVRKFKQRDKQQVKDFVKCLIQVIRNIQVISVKDLQINIHVNNNNKLICCVKEEFVIVFNESKYTMYIDSAATSGGLSRAWEEIAYMLCLNIPSILPNSLNRSSCLEFKTILSSFLQLESERDMRQILDNEQLDMTALDSEREIVIGKEISEEWITLYEFYCHKYNVFYRQEPVGYSNDEDTLVWAVVLCYANENGKYSVAVAEDEKMELCAGDIHKARPKPNGSEIASESYTYSPCNEPSD